MSQTSSHRTADTAIVEGIGVLKNRLRRHFSHCSRTPPSSIIFHQYNPFLLDILIRWNNETLYSQLLLFVAKYVFKALELPVWIFFDLLIL